MVIKYKAGDVAKDLKLTSKQVVDLVTERYGEPVKHTSPLRIEQLDFVFDHFTKESAVDSFEDYFTKKPVKKAAPKAEKPEKAEKVEKPADAPAAESAPEEKKVAKPLQKIEKAEESNEPSSAPKVAQQSVGQPAVAAQPRQPGAPAAQQQKPPAPKPLPQKPQKSTPPTAPRLRERKNQDGPITQRKDVVTVHVDTRLSEVNLDKFNTRYDDIAQAKNQNQQRNAPVGKKQKFAKAQQKRNAPFQKRRETEAERLQRIQLEKARSAQLKVMIPDEITVGELALRLKATVANVIRKLMPLGVMAAQNDVIDFDTASLVAEEMGAKVEREIHVSIEERLFESDEENGANSVSRPPVVVVMGHVDHGKTSLLDAIRKTNVTAGEAGGITQHIGAYQVIINDRKITFLDTPGHEAFTSMRARGANLTDIVILVVAADDGIMPQTVEAINHAKAAEVPIIVAINKMDKPEANPDRVMQGLTEYGLVPEAWGGDVVVQQVSAITKQGIPELLEMITLISDVRELQADPTRRAKGAVVEASLDKGLGPVATVLVQKGTLHKGDVVIAGTAVGRIRTMRNDKGELVEQAGPSTPVLVTGLTEVPAAGDVFEAVEDERLARELAVQRGEQQKEARFGAYQKVTLENLFSQIAQGEMKEFPIVVKADVQGSAEAVRQSLEKLSNAEVQVKVIHTGVGAINKSDVMLASASNAIIIGFNVRPDPIAKQEAEQAEVELRMYRVIYDAIEEVQAAIKGMLAPKIREVEHGRIEVRQVYRISSVGTIAGCYVLEGKVMRNDRIRVVRDGVVLAEDTIDSLRRFKDDVREVAAGYECGIGLDKFSDIREGDIYESFVMEEYRE